jgi:glucosamine kinase
LGTGSNISFFDGEDVHSGKHGLGYVLGDEGSGTWFGKSLITDFLYCNMPADIHALFNKTYQVNKETIINNVYQKSAANSYLASFAKFVSEIRTSTYGQQLIKRSFTEFIETNIKTYHQYHRYKCHFVGSIAFVFADELRALCEEHHVQTGKIIKQPIFDLLQFIVSRGE